VNAKTEIFIVSMSPLAKFSIKSKKMKKKFTIAIFLTLFSIGTFAQIPLVYDKENTGSSYPAPPLPTLSELPVVDPLPDPFAWSDGSGRSTNFNDWERRRNEIKKEIEHYEIGRKPDKPGDIVATWIPGATPTVGTLRVVVTVNGQVLTINSAVTLPSGSGPFPAVIGMNSQSGSIPGDIFSSRNIARITFSHNNITTYNAPSNNNPFYRLYPDQNITNSGQYAAWAWGVSRIIDGLELLQGTIPIDLKHLAVTGCSYAGKMALFAGAYDERIALTIAQESGGGGIPAWRVSEFGGDVEKLGATSNQWFKDDMFQFSGLNVPKLPHDHHELMAMVAPRALLVTGNTDFMWLSNLAAYVTSRATKEIYKTLGISDRFGFYIDGQHGHCAIPTSQRPAIEAFVDKFLLGKTEVNTDTVTIHPYGNMEHKSWYEWWGTGNPVFPNEGSATKIWLETECGTVGANWEVGSDPAASKGAYIAMKPGFAASTGSVPPNTDANRVVIPFNIDVAGTYNFLGRAIGPSPTQDSYWVRVDNGTFVSANGLTSTNWQWGRLITPVPLTPGPHSFTIIYREPGGKLDKILITTSNASVITPEILGPNCGVPPVVTVANFAIDGGASCGELGTIAATDADDIIYPKSTVFQKWQIVGGSSIFALDAATGKLTIANPTAIDFSKTSYTVIVTVSDGYFTSNPQAITITIPKKIKVCHKGGNVISIGKMDVLEHLAHGDCMGVCADGIDKGKPSASRLTTSNVVQVYPNPSRGVININLGTNSQNIRKIEVLDISGRLVMQLNVGKVQALTIPGGKLKAGVYMIRMQGNNIMTQKLVVQ
jgi:hypothetical protein